jgi:hypothetical protein
MKLVAWQTTQPVAGRCEQTDGCFRAAVQPVGGKAQVPLEITVGSGELGADGTMEDSSTDLDDVMDCVCNPRLQNRRRT